METDASWSFLILILSVITVVECQRQEGAIWIPSNHYFNRTESRMPKWLIIHGTAGGTSAEAVARWFQNPASQVATHYVIDQQGVIVQCVDERFGAWANGRIENGRDPWWGPENPNFSTISIEHVKSLTDNSNNLTDVQKAASFALIKNITKRHPGIRRAWGNSEGGIIGHFSMSPQSRERCPGPYPWEEMFTFQTGIKQLPMCLGTVTALYVNVRSQPNTSSDIIGTLPQFRVINIKDKVEGQRIYGNEDWYQLHSGGYVTAYYVRIHIKQPSWCYSGSSSIK